MKSLLTVFERKHMVGKYGQYLYEGDEVMIDSNTDYKYKITKIHELGNFDIKAIARTVGEGWQDLPNGVLFHQIASHAKDFYK